MNETNDEADLKMTRGKQELESSSSTAREKIFKIKKKKKWKMKRKDNDERKWKKENVVRYMWWGLKSEKGGFLAN